MQDGYEMFVGKKVKVVYRDRDEEKVIRGVFTSSDEHSIIILGERDGQPVVIGKTALVMMRIDE